jgi:hypothetical protein
MALFLERLASLWCAWGGSGFGLQCFSNRLIKFKTKDGRSGSIALDDAGNPTVIRKIGKDVATVKLSANNWFLDRIENEKARVHPSFFILSTDYFFLCKRFCVHITQWLTTAIKLDFRYRAESRIPSPACRWLYT